MGDQGNEMVDPFHGARARNSRARNSRARNPGARSPGVPPPPPPESIVRLAYKAVLRRDPDPSGFATFTAALRNGHSVPWLIEQLAASDEYHALTRPTAPLQVQPVSALSFALPMQLDPDSTPAELQALWDHVARTWSVLGETEPHWSVLTADEFKADALTPAALDAFHRSGEQEVFRLNAWLRRAGIIPDPAAICAEYGCGVARITRPLARQYRRVRAFDVSAPHLRAARAQVEAEGIGNIDFIHVAGPADLAALDGIDVFYSLIALQHSPPPIILDVLARAFSALRPGGYAFFQLPTFATDYQYSARTHLQQVATGTATEMEVHFVPQHAVLALAHRAGLTVAEIQPDMCIGNHDRWISNTFLLVRP